MINRRHIRVKVMQSVYSMLQSHDTDLEKENKFLRLSIKKMTTLYVLNLDLILRVQLLAKQRIEKAKNKILASKEDLNPNTKFIDNSLIKVLSGSVSLEGFIELNKLDNWEFDNEFVRIVLDELVNTEFYKSYMTSLESSFNQERDLVVNLFEKVIAPNQKLADYYEDKFISWVGDFSYVNTLVIRTLETMSLKKPFVLKNIFKDKDDEHFVTDLFSKVMLHQHTYDDIIQEKCINWELDRISEVDMILIKMGITEFLHFPSIPTRVTINEYIELAKDYSTPKSGRFINGVLDKLSKEFESNGSMVKLGRGLM